MGRHLAVWPARGKDTDQGNAAIGVAGYSRGLFSTYWNQSATMEEFLRLAELLNKTLLVL